MNLSEPGKTEEEQLDTSSAGLSESETDVTSAEAEVTGDAEAVQTDAAVSDGDDAPATTQANNEDNAEDAEPVAEDAATEDEPEPEDENALRRGMLLDGKIARTTPTSVYIDLGEGREGVVPGRELELMSRSMLEEMTPGADITVYVVNPRNHRGEILLSINHALEETDWREAEEYRASKEVYTGRIGGYNKGGLIVRFGRLRGFVPQSQIADTRYRLMKGKTPEERYGKFVNDEINVKVMEVDRSRNRLILSERAAMREVRQHRKEALIGELEVGETRTGTVVSLEN
ncbi:MAG: S1 RNA-binding domain-containing protein, partial [Aggregatilineales bacterium]